METNGQEIDLNKVVNEVATEQAAKAGKTTENYIKDLKTELQLNSKSTVGTSELIELVNLIVITHQEKTLLRSDMYEFISQFIVQPNMDNGNGRRFIKHYPKVGRQWADVEGKFVPEELSKTAFKVQFIKFKDDAGNPMPEANQLVFDATYSVVDMIQYFIRGQLTEFIQDEIIGKIAQSIDITLYHLIMTEIVKPVGKQMVGTAKNLFDALTTEVFPECSEMLQNSSDYNVDQTNKFAIDASRKDDLIAIVSPKLNAKLESNVMSQLFNQGNVKITNYVGKVHVSNRKFIDNDPSGIFKTDTVGYVDDNTIIIFDRRNYFKCLKMLEFTGEQDYPLNMSKMRVSHLWFTKGKLEWGKALFYTNENLMVMPGNEAETI